MAVVNLDVVNPTPADVTVNGHTALTGRITKLAIDNTTADAYTFLAAGCGLLADGTSVEQREQIGFMAESDEHDVR